MDLTEAEDIKKRWQEFTEELYKKDLHDPDNHNDVITHPEPDILECKVKLALGSITTNKTSGGAAGIQKLFCGIYSTFKCSFDEFVGEKVFSPSYSSAILAPPPLLYHIFVVVQLPSCVRLFMTS